MASMQELRAQAKSAGVPTSEIRSAESAEELQGLIAGYSGANRKGKVVVKKSSKTKAAVRKTTARKTTVSKPAAKRGRPKGSVNKTATRKPAAKKTAVSKPTNGRTRNVESTAGRHILSDVDYSQTDGWNPRKGSAPDVILNALRKARGNRSKAFDALVSDIWDFVGRKMQDGSKRTKASAEAMLRYRIARTDWDFALKTGQHEKSEDRVQYGTGGTGAGTFKRAKKSTATKAPARRGRPPKAKTGATAPKKRGRPVGSKNAPKATARKTTTRKAPAKRTMKRK